MKRFILVLFVVILSACDNLPQPDKFAQDRQILSLVSYLTFRDEVQSALDEWKMGLYVSLQSNHIIIFTDSSCVLPYIVGEDYAVLCMKGAKMNFLGTTMQMSFHNGVVDKSVIFIYTDNLTSDIHETLVHEIGHSLGLKHSSDPKDIMYPYQHYTTRKPSAAELATIHDAYSNLQIPEQEEQRFEQFQAYREMSDLKGGYQIY